MKYYFNIPFLVAVYLFFISCGDKMKSMVGVKIRRDL